jgi:CRISPR-associated endonuclease Cas1
MERCRISTYESHVIAEKNNKKINIPIRNTQLLIIGNGTSITSEAMYLCSKERCHIAQSKGGLSIHTIFHSGLYPNPVKITSQVLLTQDPIKRLKIAKYLAISKLNTFKINTDSEKGKIHKVIDISEILGIEGAITKKEYKYLFGNNFQRSFDRSDKLNSNINILNSVFYSLITSIVYSLGYHPSIGFLHGHTRRGGLVFDIADIFKHELYLKNIDLLNSDKNVTREFSLLMQNGKNKIIKNIIEQIEYILSGVI